MQKTHITHAYRSEGIPRTGYFIPVRDGVGLVAARNYPAVAFPQPLANKVATTLGGNVFLEQKLTALVCYLCTNQLIGGTFHLECPG